MADYASKTAGLSLMEHGAYTLLLDMSYSTEKPLPSALEPLYRLCRAMTKAEQLAVKVVAEQFFPVGTDGIRHNARVEKELPKAQATIAAARTNGVMGGRPAKNPRNNPVGSAEEPTAKAPHISNTQPLNAQPSSPKKNGAARRCSLPAGFEISTRVREWAAEKGFEKYLAQHLEQFMSYVKKMQPKYADWDEALMGCIRDDWGDVRKKSGGVPLASVRPSRICSDCRQPTFTWTGDRCDACWKKYMGMAA
jgi:uncharacterized protein YdaU (DUF1376 family)